MHFHQRHIIPASLILLLLAATACERGGSQKSADEPDEPPKSEQPLEQPPKSVDGPMIPAKGGEFAPSLARVASDDPNVEHLTQKEECAECHAEIVEEWSDSMHAFASFNNPLYRKAFDDFVAENGHEKGNFCAGCHDPAPMLQGKIGQKVEPDLKSAHAGVTCNTCHGVTEATKDGNGSYTLTTSEIPIPKEGDDESLAKHKERAAMPALKSDAMCVSCHRGFLSPATGHDVFILGFDEFGPWRRSGWAGNRVTRVDEKVADQSCTDCHMPKDPDTGHASHRFPGGHTTFADMIDSAEQMEAVREMIEDAASIDVAAAGEGGERFPSDPGELAVESGTDFWVDVVVRNLKGGHNFPGGQRDLRDTWIKVTVTDADGQVLAEAGGDHRQTGDELSAHRLRALLLSSSAETEKTHSVAHFRTKAYDHTIGPRNAELARYAWQVPESFDPARFPLTVEATLLHRRVSKTFQSDICQASKTERGRAFLAETTEQFGVSPDPCIEQPVTTLVSDTATVGPDGFAAGDNKPEWKRWFDRGLALQSHLSERLDEAIASFDRSIARLEASELGEDAREHRRAMGLVGQAQVMARQRRHKEAISVFDEAEELIGEHPAIFVGRGDAYAKVWQFDEAVDEYRRAAEMADDDRVWRKLAVGLGSLGRHRESLTAAQQGLEIEPRDPDLLRSQMIAVRKLDTPDDWKERAAEAFNAFKRDEEAHLLKAECSDRSEVCQLERLPVHTHEMESAE
jgi:tetratricopeptide (TPR) repeat protein